MTDPAAPPGPDDRPAAPNDSEESMIAPVDVQADPSHWLPGRAVLVVAIISTVVLLVTVVVCLLIWFTPGIDPVQIPTVEKA